MDTISINWDALGAVGGIVGAIAVVITLLYLASQAKTNALAMNRAAMQATLMGRGESTRFLSSNPEISELIWRGATEPEQLSESEWLRFFLICGSIVRPIEVAYMDYSAGVMEYELWQGQEQAILFWFSKPGVQKWLDQYGQTLYPDFRNYIKVLMADFEKDQAMIETYQTTRKR